LITRNSDAGLQAQILITRNSDAPS